MRAARWWHLGTAVVSGAALLLQLVIILGRDNDTALIRLVRLLSFFTIQSNIFVTVVSVTLFLQPDRDGPLWRIVRLISLACITVTGVVYVSVLRGLYELTPTDRVADTGLHYLTPVLVVVGWVLFGPRPRIGLRTIALTLIFPVLWLGYTLVRGALTDEYPYPFLDVPINGYAVVALNCLLVTGLFLAVAGVFRLLDARLGPAPSEAARERGSRRAQLR